MARGEKVYAVVAGRNPGLYDSWEEASRQVNGYSGSIYRGFSNRDEANNYMAKQGVWGFGGCGGPGTSSRGSVAAAASRVPDASRPGAPGAGLPSYARVSRAYVERHRGPKESAGPAGWSTRVGAGAPGQKRPRSPESETAAVARGVTPGGSGSAAAASIGTRVGEASRCETREGGARAADARPLGSSRSGPGPRSPAGENPGGVEETAGRPSAAAPAAAPASLPNQALFPSISLPASRRVQIEFDGASRSNPGPAGLGVVLRDADTRATLSRFSAYIGPAQTNNEAEYAGMIAGLAAARAAGAADVRLLGDSSLCLKQVARAWKVQAQGLQRYAVVARRLADGVPGDFSAQHVPRAKNADADALSNRGIDDYVRGDNRVWNLDALVAELEKVGVDLGDLDAAVDEMERTESAPARARSATRTYRRS